jgi:hypothetical protein
MAIPVISYEKTGCYRLLNLLANNMVTKEFVFVGRWPLKYDLKIDHFNGWSPPFF